MFNYPDGMSMDELNGPESLADQVREDDLVLQDGIYDGQPTIIGQDGDFNTAEDFIENQFDVNRNDLLKHLDLTNDAVANSFVYSEDFIEYLQKNVDSDLDQILLDDYDGIYGSDATDLPAI